MGNLIASFFQHFQQHHHYPINLIVLLQGCHLPYHHYLLLLHYLLYLIRYFSHPFHHPHFQSIQHHHLHCRLKPLTLVHCCFNATKQNFILALGGFSQFNFRWYLGSMARLDLRHLNKVIHPALFGFILRHHYYFLICCWHRYLLNYFQNFHQQQHLPNFLALPLEQVHLSQFDLPAVDLARSLELLLEQDHYLFVLLPIKWGR